MTDPAPETGIPEPGRRGRLLTFRSGGWVLALAAVLSLLLIAWAVAPVMLGTAPRRLGDGESVESYGFDLRNLQVPREVLVPAMPHRDMIEPMDDPTILDGQRVARLNRERGLYLVPGERVIGVVVDGAARAYPVSVMNVHEVVHDEIAGVPIALTWHWPSGVAAAFDRRVDGRAIEFGVSGLVYNSTQVLYERGPDEAPRGGERLFSQMLRRWISGPEPATDEAPAAIDAQLVSWAQWLDRHPETTVVDRDPEMRRRRYTKSDPDHYRVLGRPIFPVEPKLPEDAALRPLEEVVAVRDGGAWRAYPLALIAERADDDGRWRAGPVEFAYDRASRTAFVEGPASLDLAHAYWFVWHAFHPDAEPVAGGDAPSRPSP